MQAIILAGGRGERMRHLTKDRPKPLVQILGTPIIEFQLAQLKKHGITDVAVYGSYQSEVLEEHLAGLTVGMNIEHRVKDFEAGSAGCVKDALELLPPDEKALLVVFGDVIADVNYTELMNQHHQAFGGPYLTVVDIPSKSRFGHLVFGENGKVSGFKEKPLTHTAGGIYVVNRHLLDEALPDTGDFSHGILAPLIRTQLRDVRAYEHSGYWHDLASPGDVKKVEKDILEGRLFLSSQGIEGRARGMSSSPERG